MNKVVIHIGHHKTGTTWLQKNYFSEKSLFNLLNDFECPWLDPICKALIKNENYQNAIALVEKKLDNNKVNVISAERLSGHPISGGYDVKDIAVRLKRLIDNPKIIIVTRRAEEFVFSAYIQLVREGYEGTLKNFLFDEHWKTTGPTKEYFLQRNILNIYTELFDEDELLILNFEEFKSSKNVYIQKINAFLNVDYFPSEKQLNIDVGSAFSNRRTRALRKLNRFRKSEYNQFPIINLGEKVIKMSKIFAPIFSNAPLRDDKLIDNFLTKD